MKSKRIHFNLPGHVHELTFTCFRGQPFLKKEKACRYLAEAIQQAKRKHRFLLLAYVFMPNHVHLLIYPTEEKYSISAILHSIKQSVARRVLLYMKKLHPCNMTKFETGLKSKPYRFWQDGGGYDRNIVSDVALKESIKYINNNPVRGGLVLLPQEWEWSSAGEWLKLSAGPLPIDLDDVRLL